MTQLSLVVAGAIPAGVDPKLLDRAVALVGQLPESGGLRSTDCGQRIINLKLVDDAEIQALNKKYAGNDKPTDVLSFNYAEAGSTSGEELGDIAISLETAARQAEQAGTSLETEITLLLVHGCLHLLGHDHAGAEERKEMDQQQAVIMQKLGLTYRNFPWDLSKA